VSYKPIGKWNFCHIILAGSVELKCKKSADTEESQDKV